MNSGAFAEALCKVRDTGPVNFQPISSVGHASLTSRRRTGQCSAGSGTRTRFSRLRAEVPNPWQNPARGPTSRERDRERVPCLPGGFVATTELRRNCRPRWDSRQCRMDPVHDREALACLAYSRPAGSPTEDQADRERCRESGVALSGLLPLGPRAESSRTIPRTRVVKKLVESS